MKRCLFVFTLSQFKALPIDVKTLLNLYGGPEFVSGDVVTFTLKGLSIEHVEANLKKFNVEYSKDCT